MTAVSVLSIVMVSARASAAERSAPVGDTARALPGVNRAPIAGAAQGASAALDVGYGLTESQQDEGAHHRAFGSAGFGYGFASGLDLGLLVGARHDAHPSDPVGSDSGTTGSTSLLARMGRAVGSLRFGADLGATFPGAEQLGTSLESPALDARALLAWVQPGGWRVAGFGGYRLDRTAGVAKHATQYRAGDRLALSASESDAVLLGLGAIYPLGKLEVLLETSADVMTSSRAGSALESPIRMDAGGRYALSPRLSAEFLSELTVSQRPDSKPTSPLMPLEPRFSVALGVRYRFSVPSKARVAPTAPMTPVAPVAPRVDQPLVTNRISVTVVDAAGHPLSDVTVAIATKRGRYELAFARDSTFVAEAVPVGESELRVDGERLRAVRRPLKIERGEPVEVRVEMSAAGASGQIRGLVRAFDGQGLPAKVRIHPGAIEVTSGPDGAFRAEVSPGQYEVRVERPGFESQLSKVKVEADGVVILNVDLRTKVP